MNKAFDNIIDLVESYIEDAKSEGDYHYIRPFELVIQGVRELAKGYNDGWIPCSDSLPEAYDLNDYNIEDSASYLIQRRCGVMDVAHYIKIYGESYFSANSIEIKDVIAWQPLPEPYKERDE